MFHTAILAFNTLKFSNESITPNWGCKFGNLRTDLQKLIGNRELVDFWKMNLLAFTSCLQYIMLQGIKNPLISNQHYTDDAC